MLKLLVTTAVLLAPYALPATAQTTGNWTQQLPTNTPPPREAAGMAYDSSHSQIVLFGGSTGAAPLNDTWVWDGSNWTQRLLVPTPSPRSSPAMVYDPVHGQTVLFGGNTANPGATLVSLTDTWTWDGG